MPIITRKIEVKMHYSASEDPEEKEQLWNKWRDINNHLYLAANRIVSHLFFNDEYENRLKVHSKEYVEIEKILKYSKRNKLTAEEISSLRNRKKELDAEIKKKKIEFLEGGSERNSTFQVVNSEFAEWIPTDILTCLKDEVVKIYNNYRKEIKNGDRSISNYKKGLPIPFPIIKNKALKLAVREDGTYYVKLPGSQQDKYKIVLDLYLGADRSNNKIILDRILSGEYKLASTARVQEKKKKIFLDLAVDIPRKEYEIDEDIVVGVDLGINVPVVVAVKGEEYCSKHNFIGSRDEFLKVRERLNAKKRELQKSLSTSVNGGRGRKHKLGALERYREKEKNWVQSQNHLYSRAVIDFALKNKAGVIQMEKLKNYGKSVDGDVEKGYEYLLRYWSYYQLQSMIEYKAASHGIKVRYIDPYHTSQTCSYCGHWEKGQREGQAVFRCKNPECEKGKGKKNKDGEYEGINADWNAARNIAASTKVLEEK